MPSRPRHLHHPPDSPPLATDPEPFTHPEDVPAQSGLITSLERSRHVVHCNRRFAGLPASLTDIDRSQMALAFYCRGTMNICGALDTRLSAPECEAWQGWIWAQQRARDRLPPDPFSSTQGAPSSIAVRLHGCVGAASHATHCALLSLATLLDDIGRLDQAGFVCFVRACQDANGG
ncbi:hypothetical protein K488DRAFT_92392 [Vararia minispora EC-137]|uniref:Uncharacterized protein n=1 Tax=Vararia minispora EC-137 TaxID=1314806 RepID=A0ACB8Q487_9AGAM|nr:hypothetical protein K488DRAFT_92392 [Vararia minispora EC-137]